MPLTNLNQMRVCGYCDLDLPWIDSGRRNSRGLRIMVDDQGRPWKFRKCPDCVAGYQEQYYQDHIETLTDYRRSYYQERQEGIKEQQRQYRQRPDAQTRDRQRKQTPEYKAYQEAYRQRPEVLARDAEYSANRRSTLRNVSDGTVTAEFLDDLRWFVQDNCCGYCGAELNDINHDPRQATKDHIDALENGGMHTYTNILFVCRFCNGSKGTRDWREFVATLGPMVS